MDKEFEIQNIGTQKKILGIRLSAVLEIFLFFILTTLIAFFLDFPLNYFDTCPHPFWLIVILISSQYGTIEGIFAAFIATLIYLMGPLPLQNVLEDKFEYTFSLIKNPLMWFVAAVILGEIRMRHIRERNFLKESALNATAKEKTITNSYVALKKIKENLETRLVSEMQTALMAYSAFKRLESLGDKDEILKGTLDLTRILIIPDQFSIYLKEQDQLKCISHEGWESENQFEKNYTADSPLYQAIVDEDRVISVIHDPSILGTEGIIAVPIADPHKGIVHGMIKIEKMSFSKLRMSVIETLRSIGEWVGCAYSSFLKEHVDQVSSLFAEKEFLKQMGARLNCDMSLLTFALIDPLTFEEERLKEIKNILKTIISKKLRVVDRILEMDSTGTAFTILLINTSLENANNVKEKLMQAIDEEAGKKLKFFYHVSALYVKR